jgi:hypothetical protein
MFVDGETRAFGVCEGARFHVGEDQLRDPQREQLCQCGQQLGLAPGRVASGGGVGLSAQSDDQRAVDLVHDVVQSAAELGQGSDLVARQVAGQHGPDLVAHVSLPVGRLRGRGAGAVPVASPQDGHAASKPELPHPRARPGAVSCVVRKQPYT